MKSRLFVYIYFFFALNSASSMTLDQYLAEVRTKHSGLESSKIGREAKQSREGEGSLIFGPNLFLNGQYIDDQRPVNAPSFQGTQTLIKNYQAGLAQNFRSGTKAQVSYNYRYTEINGAAPGILPRSRFYDMYPQFELSQSLWRNFWGLETKAQEQVQNSQILAQKFADQFQYKEINFKAELAFWRYYFAQKAEVVLKESLERAKRLRDWNKTRVSRHLTDEADLLQAESNYESKEIELKNAYIEFESARKNFNMLREVSDDGVNIELNAPDSFDANNLTLPQKSTREDVLISLYSSKMKDAEATLGEQRNLPTFEVYGQYALYGRDVDFNESVDKSFSREHPYKVIGVRFSTPLEVWDTFSYKKSYSQEKNAAELNHQRKLFEAEKEWDELTEKFTEYKKRFHLSIKLEELQKKKLAVEKNQYNRGRTTTFQVLQFEQDYANAQLLKLRNEFELISLHSQLKLYSEVKYE